jgi:hypothetical protein
MGQHKIRAPALHGIGFAVGQFGRRRWRSKPKATSPDTTSERRASSEGAVFELAP